MDRLSGVLEDRDFERIYERIKAERAALRQRLSELEGADCFCADEDWTKAIVQKFIDQGLASREVLVSLIERVELTEGKEVIIRFRFAQPEKMS